MTRVPRCTALPRAFVVLNGPDDVRLCPYEGRKTRFSRPVIRKILPTLHVWSGLFLRQEHALEGVRHPDRHPPTSRVAASVRSVIHYHLYTRGRPFVEPIDIHKLVIIIFVCQEVPSRFHRLHLVFVCAVNRVILYVRLHERHSFRTRQRFFPVHRTQFLFPRRYHRVSQKTTEFQMCVRKCQVARVREVQLVHRAMCRHPNTDSSILIVCFCRASL